MARLYVLAHFDDEYCAVPLVREGVAAGLDQWFFYMADYADPALAARRLAETRALVASLGVDPSRVIHVGPGTGAVDGRVHRALPAAYAALKTAAAEARPVAGLVTLAWEGGHMDHDMCALMTVRLAAELGDPPIETISLYNGLSLPGPMFHGAAPLTQNGPVRRIRSSPGQWLSWLIGVRYFPSQARTWAGLWPAMFWSYALRGFGVQRLDPARVRERPHPGPLFYERMFKTPYAEVRAAADAFLSQKP